MPGLKRARTHADEFKDLEDRAPIDFDPEDEAPPSDDESNDDSAPEDEAADGISARQHYQPVGKSKLRQQGPEALGPQYAGSRVTRKGVTASEQEEHDPFGEYSSDEESDINDSESELEADDNASNAESAEEDMDDEEMGDGSVTGDTSVSEDDDDDEDEDMDAHQRDAKDERAELRRIMNEQSNVTAAISEATRVDAEKGRAVKRQRKTFDALLNTRIRMQQSLIAVNSMQAQLFSSTGTSVSEAAGKQAQGGEAYSTAEAAATKLWNTIESLRQTLAQPSPNPAKSTQTPTTKALKINTSTPTPQIWTHMQSREKTSLPSRQSTLNKWSRKTGAASSAQNQTTTPRRLGSSLTSTQAQDEGITSMLATHLSSTNLPRLVARTKIPRSCAPIQASSTGRGGNNANANANTNTKTSNSTTANGTNSDQPLTNTTTTQTEEIYDDADFYATLLQDLLAQRQLDDLSHASITTSTSTAQQPEASLTTQLRAARAASKTKRDVDTRASKGRKMRYTVHEKLQNFMAPEGDDGGLGGMWGARQREELFGSLLGRRLVLDERDGGVGAGAGEEGGAAAEGDEGEMGEEEALMLFRS